MNRTLPGYRGKTNYTEIRRWYARLGIRAEGLRAPSTKNTYNYDLAMVGSELLGASPIKVL